MKINKQRKKVFLVLAGMFLLGFSTYVWCKKYFGKYVESKEACYANIDDYEKCADYFKNMAIVISDGFGKADLYYEEVKYIYDNTINDGRLSNSYIAISSLVIRATSSFDLASMCFQDAEAAYLKHRNNFALDENYILLVTNFLAKEEYDVSSIEDLYGKIIDAYKRDPTIRATIGLVSAIGKYIKKRPKTVVATSQLMYSIGINKIDADDFLSAYLVNNLIVTLKKILELEVGVKVKMDCCKKIDRVYAKAQKLGIDIDFKLLAAERSVNAAYQEAKSRCRDFGYQSDSTKAEI